jgi:hypothetical protein
LGIFAFLHFVLIAASLWLLAIAAGMRLLRVTGFTSLTPGERAVFGGTLGMGTLALGTFLAGTVSAGHRWLLTALVAALLLGMAAAGLREVVPGLRKAGHALRSTRLRAPDAVLLLLAIAIVLVALLRANLPVVADYDSLEYHFAAPAQWWRAGEISFIRDIVYTSFPQNVEMLYLACMTAMASPDLGVVVGLQVGIGFVVLAAAAVATCGRRLGSPAGGYAGALLLLTTPMLPELGTLNSYVVELPLAAYGFMALYAFILLHTASARAERRRYAILTGVLVGLALGCKYPALLFVLLPILTFLLVGGLVHIATLRRAVLEAALVGAVALVVFSPWLVRNAVNTGNPVYPLLHHTFGSDNWSDEQDAKFAKAHATSDVSLLDLGSRFWTFAVWRAQPDKEFEGPWRPPASPFLLVFALLPFAMADPRSTRGMMYLAIAFLAVAAIQHFSVHSLGNSQPLRFAQAGGVLVLVTLPAFLMRSGPLIYAALHFDIWMLTWYTLTHQIDRFLDPSVPAVALLAGIGYASITDRGSHRIAKALLGTALAYALATALLIHGGPLGYLFYPRDKFIAAATEGSTYCDPAIRALNTHLGPNGKVLFLGEARTFYCTVPVAASTVFDRNPLERALESADLAEPSSDVRAALLEQGFTHLYVSWQEYQRLDRSYRYRFYGRDLRGFSRYDLRALIAEMLAQGHLRPVRWFPDGPRIRQHFAIYEIVRP